MREKMAFRWMGHILMVSIGMMVCLAEGVELDQNETTRYDRGSVEWLSKTSVRIEDATVVLNSEPMSDIVFEFEGRAPADAKDVGIWAAFRQQDRNNRYMIGLRGAPHSDIYLARYAVDGHDRMLAIKPVKTLQPGEWGAIKVVVKGKRITVFLNGREVFSAVDPSAPFKMGQVALGGGYHMSEYRNVRVAELIKSNASGEVFADGAVKINFQPADSQHLDGWQADSGAVYEEKRGHGWSAPLETRDRSAGSLTDTLVAFGHKETDVEYRISASPGEYLLTLHHGDQFTSHLNMVYDGQSVLDRAVAGKYHRVYRQVTVGENGLALRFHRRASDPGLSLNWLVLEPRSGLVDGQWALGEIGVGKEGLRKEQRATYAPVTIDAISADRMEVSLDGDWLFLPDSEFNSVEVPQAPDIDDMSWHVMNVPDLWSPYSAWLFGEKMSTLPTDKGASDNYYELRNARVDALTFDWENTHSAWYRKHIVLPKLPAHKRVELCFDAIAKVSQIYVNGNFVGKNIGMFGEIKFDITKYLNEGSNVVAVKVDEELLTIENPDEILDVAISVEVTRKMLTALPHGMMRDDPRGIWQPTKLVITDAIRITDIYIKPSLDGAEVEVEIKNMNDHPVHVDPHLKVSGFTIKDELVTLVGAEAEIPADSTQVITLRFEGVAPRLWEPANPQLYTFDVALQQDSSVVDRLSVVSGFKTFETRGARLFLNGRPYVLRGGNHCPNILAPNDGMLADRFFEIMHENNLNSTRFHAVPGTTAWMAAADRQGVLISYEGTWPWLLIKGPIPSQTSIDIWMDEYERVIRKYRNHPSLMLWTINNEMKFHYHYNKDKNKTPEKTADCLARWKIVSKAVAMIREVDPTHPIVADSCYVRKKHWGFDESPSELDIDDGDIDDLHEYVNWYHPTFFNLPYGPDGMNSKDRPYIGQEISTGYYNVDSGHPCRAYLFAHQVPQWIVGQYAYEHRDPAIFGRRHTMLTKELAEYYRREQRENWDGSMIFGLVTWFKDPWDSDKITPYPVITEGLRRAMEPVLVSARLTSRHAFGETVFTVPVSVVNDDETGKNLNAGKLRWSFVVSGKTLSQGTVNTPEVAYYSNEKMDVTIKTPAVKGCVDADLVFELLVDGIVVSENRYAYRLGNRDWATAPVKKISGKTYVYKPSPKLEALLNSLPIETISVFDMDTLKLGKEDRIIVNGAVDSFGTVLSAGIGKVIWVHPGKYGVAMFPSALKKYIGRKGEIVTMSAEESPVFDGLKIGDMAWMGGPSAPKVPYSSVGGYHVYWKNPALSVLAEQTRDHGYLRVPSDRLGSWVTPLVRIQEAGLTPVILSEISLNAVAADPVALRFWANLIAQP